MAETSQSFFQLYPLNENTLYLCFDTKGKTTLALSLAERLASCRQVLEEGCAPWLSDCVPAYASLLIYYDITRIPEQEALEKCRQLISENLRATDNALDTRQHSIPVCYDVTVAWDLQTLAQSKHMGVDEFIQRHTEQEYAVFANGFIPGFAYLGFVTEDLQAPRLATPRKSVPKGAVGIADRQTGIYPASSPGGWNIIGRTPQALLNPKTHQPLLRVGDRVRFQAISLEEFYALGGEG